MSDTAKVVHLPRAKKIRSLVTLTDTMVSIKLVQEEILHAKVSYTELARKAQLANSTVSNIAIGHTRFPRIETIIRILHALGWVIQATRT